MTPNTSRVTATIGSARFEAEGPAEVVLTQYAHFLKSLKGSPAPEPATGPVPWGVSILRRCFTVGVMSTPAAQPPALRFLQRFGPASTVAP